MNPYLQIFVGVMMMSTAVAYAMWAYVRIWVLRQDLFEIRDRLWRIMQEAGTLNDPGHRSTRDRINAMIRVAPFYSVAFIFPLSISRGHNNDYAPQDLLPPVKKAKEEALHRIVKSIFFETFSGIVATPFLIAWKLSGRFWKYVSRDVSETGATFDRIHRKAGT